MIQHVLLQGVGHSLQYIYELMQQSTILLNCVCVCVCVTVHAYIHVLENILQLSLVNRHIFPMHEGKHCKQI